MILDFTISNYRSIKDSQTLSFEATSDKHLEDYYVVKKGKYRILKIATILGPNASGKSNIIKAFAMLHDLFLAPCTNKSSRIAYSKFALDAAMQKQNSQMIVNFICGEKKYHYEVTFNNRYVVSELLKCHPFDSLRAHTVYERITDKETLMSTIKWGGRYGMVIGARELNINLLHNRTVFGAFQMSNVDIPWMKQILDWLSSYMLPIVRTTEQNLFEYTSEQVLQNPGEKQMVASMLRKADVGIQDFEIEKKNKEIPDRILKMLMSNDEISLETKNRIKDNPFAESIQVKMLHDSVEGGTFLDYNQESHGTHRYYELSGVLLQLILNAHFVAIDELDSRLHPDLYRHFIITYLTNSKDSQMVFTTHMREFLADKDEFRKDAVWFTEKNKNGETELYSLADFDEKEFTSSRSNLYDAYRLGRFGGIPHLGDTFVNGRDYSN